MWVNLISNAVKYSSKSERPRIEVGGAFVGDEIRYSAQLHDVGKIAELTYELEHLAVRIDTAVRSLAPVSADDDA